MADNTSPPPLITVIIPSRNRPAELERAINSVIHQEWGPRLEVIVVDDASDPPVDIGERERLPNLRVIRNEEPKGAAAARNRGVEASVAPIIAFLDDDDEWLPEKLQAQWRVLQDPDVDFTYAGCELHTEGIGRRAVLEPFMDADRLAEELLTHNVVGMPTLVVRRELLERIGGFDERFRSANDWDLCLRLALSGKGRPVPKVLARAFQRPGRPSITTTLDLFLQGRRLFLEKHAGALAARRGAAARHHLHIGQALALGGKRSEARREIVAALRSGGLFWPALAHLVAIHLPRGVYERLGRLAWRLKGNR